MQRNEWELPDPSARERPPASRLWRWVVFGIVVIVLIAAAFTVPISRYFIYLPGPIRNVERLVTVEGAKVYPTDGTLALTTVSVETDPTFAELVDAYFDAHETVVGAEALTGGNSLKQLEKQQKVEMIQSKRAAKEVALEALGYKGPSGEGAKIVLVVPGSPADGKLHQGDVIVRIDGRRVETVCDVDAVMSTHSPGDRVRLEFRRDGSLGRVSLRTDHFRGSPDRPRIGIGMTTAGYRFDPGVQVDVDTGQIGGPSAGTMMALAIYDRLTPGDLTGGHRVAGTGTIDSCSGEVGPIGGIREKVAAAQAGGMQIFLTPAADAADARKASDGMKIVAIKSFDDAVDYLEGLSS